MKYTKEDILRIVEEEDVEFIRLQFTDITGTLKNMAITASQLENLFERNRVFDGAALLGFQYQEETDMYLVPDLDTFTIFPWRPQQGKVARFLCDVYRMDNTPFVGDSRFVLKKAISEAKAAGFEFEVGPEMEFFLFHTDENAHATTITHEQAGFFDIGPRDLGENARRDIILTLEDMGFQVESSCHSAAPAQHKIDFRYDEALQTADNIMTFRMTVRTVAKRHGLHATFMPKPTAGQYGSGMHLNMSLNKNGKNAFYDPADPSGLSKDAYYFIGGIMKHIKAITAIGNPLVNSYKRLVPGFKAPIAIGWSTRTMSPLLRIPAVREENTRIELRSPDPSANPYLLLAVCLTAGLDGIKNKIMPPESIEYDVFKLNPDELKAQGIDFIPRNLHEALDELDKDELIKDALGEYMTKLYLDIKREEWDAYRTQVSEWEMEQYLEKY